MKITVLCLSGLLILSSLAAQQKKIYIAPDDHTDYLWSADEAGYRAAFTRMLDYYIDLNDSTAGEPYPYRSKWNCDGSFWVYEYEKNRSHQQFLRLIDQIRAGTITVPLNTLPEVLGIAPLEATIRDMYYAGSLERRYGLDLELAVNMEDQVLPLGLASLWAGAGARYSWRGVCDCATKVKGLHSRPHEIYWYKGLDDQKILMKWYSLGENNMQLGGYAEARDPHKSVSLCLNKTGTPQYPYLIAAAFGKGWDDIKTTTAEFINVARSESGPDHQVIVSNEIDFFRDFEKSYGSVIPSETVSYGSTEWGNGLASLAAVSAKVKRSVEKLRTAEGLYTLVSLRDRNFARGLDSMRERAWISCGLYFDHDWTADSPVISKQQRAAWARKMADEFSSYVDTLFDLSVRRLGELTGPAVKDRETFLVFNPLSWRRTDYCDYPCDSDGNISVSEAGTGRQVPSQPVIKNNRRYLRILATDVPSLGYKVYEISRSERQRSFTQPVKVSGGTIENERYRISFSDNGVITSLIDKKDGSREWIRQVNNKYANDMGGSGITSGSALEVQNAGPVSVSLVARSDKPLKHRSEITLFGAVDRIEIENYLEQNPGAGPVSYAFSFNLDRPEIHNEEAGAILLARQQADGGNYADSICRLDWIAMNHFADLSDGDRGIVISNRDAFFMKTGNSTIEKLDPFTSQISVLAAGQIDAPALGIAGQDGDSLFENFFALKPGTSGFTPSSSMRFSLEHQNPLVAVKVNGDEVSARNSYSLFTVSNPEVLVWTMKPAEEGIEKGIILRVWNMSARDEEVVISSPLKVDRCSQTSHIETGDAEIMPSDGSLRLQIGHNRLQTYRIFLK